MKEKPEVKFLIVGDGSEKDDLLAYTDKLKIGESIIFLGYRRDVLKIYNTLDVMLLTSLTEGLPNTILEALALGVPVVSTNVGGLGELIQNNYNGLLFKAKDVKNIASGVLELLYDKDKCKKFKKFGRDKICKEFSFDSRIQKIEKLYIDLVGK